MSPKKRKKNGHLVPRLIMAVFIAIACAQTIATVGALNAPEMAFAKDEKKITFDPAVPFSSTKIEFDNSTKPIATYIQQVYTYAVGAVGILAAIMLMIGGLRWTIAGDNSSSVSEAKEIIIAAISGMVLVMTSYLILNQVNPALTDLTILKLTPLKLTSMPKESSLMDCAWAQQTSFTTESGNSTSYTGKTNSCPLGQIKASMETFCTTNKQGDDYTCCCSYKARKGCSWSTTKCTGEKDTSYRYALADLFSSGEQSQNEEAIKSCGSQGVPGDSGYCCCKVLDFSNFPCQGNICATQKTHASNELISAINCIGIHLPTDAKAEISSISDSVIVSGSETWQNCRDNGCGHSKNSCHYGGEFGPDKSYAVDIVGDKAAIDAAARKCGRHIKFVLQETSHVHISTRTCKSDKTNVENSEGGSSGGW